jgi:hypothetical protein
MNDALEILDELYAVIINNDNAETTDAEIIDLVVGYIRNKRLEFAPASGECAS